VRDAYFIGTDLRLRAQGRAIVAFGASQAGQEHDLALEHELGGDGTISGGGRGDHGSGLRDLYVEKVLVPSLRSGQIVVMDNLGAHRPKRVRELIEQRDCELIYLPPYSPDYNPIEEAFAKIKNLLRKAAARSKGALIEAMGAALSAVTADDVRGFFEHAGYRPTDHFL
jgi:hypothetical protein